jgi:hypothetical protein
MKQVEINKQAKLSPHFTLGELTGSKSHPEVYNVPSHVHIENLKRVCVWLEALRARYNERYALSEKSPTGARPQGAVFAPEPIIITSGYRSAELNRKVGGVATSNHLTGCAVDIRVAGKKQLIRYACILLDYADETKQDFDEILLERGAAGTIWLHFAVRAQGNRQKINFLKA